MRKWLKIVLLLVAILGAMPWNTAQARGVSIDIFTVTPPSPVDRGTWLLAYGKASGNVRAIWFEVNGMRKAEIGSLEQRETIKTEEFPAGNLRICFVVAEGDQTISQCLDYWVNDVTPPPSVITGGVNIDGFCKSIGYDRGRCPGDAYSCRCAGGSREDGIDMYSLCSWQYGGTLPYPGLNNAADPNGWTCNADPAYVDDPIPQPEFFCGDSQCNGGETCDSCTIDCGACSYNPPADSGENTGGYSDQSSNNSGDWGNPSNTSSSCPYPVDLTIGGQGRVTPGQPNNLRSCAGTSISGCTRTGTIPVNAIFSVLDGPVCNEGYNWWQVRYNGRTGWTADGNWSEDWVEPVFGSSSNSGSGNSSSNGSGNSTSSGGCPAHVAPVRVGGQGRVTPGVPNLLRSCAGTGCEEIGSIPSGGEFSVLAGPTCAGGLYWWRVNYQGQTGWTAEGDSSEYWIEYAGGSSSSTTDSDESNANDSEFKTDTWWENGDGRSSLPMRYSINVEYQPLGNNRYVVKQASLVFEIFPGRSAGCYAYGEINILDANGNQITYQYLERDYSRWNIQEEIISMTPMIEVGSGSNVVGVVIWFCALTSNQVLEAIGNIGEGELPNPSGDPPGGITYNSISIP